MIKLKKFDAPPDIETKLANYHARMLELQANGEPIPDSLKNAYKVAKPALVEETHGKCVYCESKVGHVYPGDVEHIIAKSKHPELTYHFGNLTYACFVCNNNKSDYHDPLLPLINPYTDDPEREFFALGFFVKERPGHHRAFVTERVLELNRPALIERRRERLDSLHDLARVYEMAPEPVKAILKDQLLQEARDDKEYAFFVRAYLHTAVNLSA